LNEVETRAASLHYRCAELNETNKRLEMGYTGASTQARGLAKLVQDLRTEIKDWKKEKSKVVQRQFHEYRGLLCGKESR
jgi:phage shock protein A